MKIRHPLPQFENERALFLVCGNHWARFYKAYNGEISEKEILKIENPKYEDREGHFETSAGGKFLGSGSVYEKPVDYVENKFLNELGKRVLAAEQEERFELIYLFAPDFMHRSIFDRLPPSSRKKVQVVVFGNFTKEHPLRLLGHLQEIYEEIEKKEKMPAKKEAFKILEKAEKARKNVKNRLP